MIERVEYVLAPPVVPGMPEPGLQVGRSGGGLRLNSSRHDDDPVDPAWTLRVQRVRRRLHCRCCFRFLELALTIDHVDRPWLTPLSFCPLGASHTPRRPRTRPTCAPARAV